MEIENKTNLEVENHIKTCQEEGHVQQVAFSTYHHALTQICFICDKVRTSINKKKVQ